MEAHVFLKCSICSKTLDGMAGSLRIKYGQNYCNDCFYENFYTCDICGNEHDTRENKYTAYNDKKYCSDCADERLVDCKYCSEIVDKKDRHTQKINDSYYHRNCFQENYLYCEDCGEVVFRDDSYYHENSDCYYCEYCWDNLGLSNHEDRRQNCYEFPTQRIPLENVTFKHLRDKKCFGIELEINDNNFNFGKVEEQSCFGSVYDGSLNCGSELRSPILQGDIGYFAVKKLCGIIKNAHVGTCAGYHIHIDARDINWQGARKVWLLYRIFEGVLYTMLPKSRQVNQYCKQSTMSIDNITRLKNQDELMNLWYSQGSGEPREDHYNSTRYYACNLHSYFYQNTIEIRQHSSTTNFEKVINWVKINQAIFRFALSHSVQDILNLQNYGNCNTNYTIIRKLFKAVVKSETLWKYYKTRFENFNADKKEYGWYKKQEELSIDTSIIGHNQRVEVENAYECGSCRDLNPSDNTCERVSCSAHPQHQVEVGR